MNARDKEFLDAIEASIIELIWALAGRDHRSSADLLEGMAARLQKASEEDDRKARREEKKNLNARWAP